MLTISTSCICRPSQVLAYYFIICRMFLVTLWNAYDTQIFAILFTATETTLLSSHFLLYRNTKPEANAM